MSKPPSTPLRPYDTTGFEPGPAGVEMLDSHPTAALDVARVAMHGVVELPRTIIGGAASAKDALKDGVVNSVRRLGARADERKHDEIVKELPEIPAQIKEDNEDIAFHRRSAHRNLSKGDPSRLITGKGRERDQRARDVAGARYDANEKLVNHTTRRGGFRTSPNPRHTISEDVRKPARNNAQVRQSREDNQAVRSINVASGAARKYLDVYGSLILDRSGEEPKVGADRKPRDLRYDWPLLPRDEVVAKLAGQRKTKAEIKAALKAYDAVHHARHEAHEIKHELEARARGDSEPVQKLKKSIEKKREKFREVPKLERRAQERRGAILASRKDRELKRSARRDAKVTRAQHRYGRVRAAELDKVLERRVVANRNAALQLRSNVLSISESVASGTPIDFGEKDTDGKPILRPATPNDLGRSLMDIRAYVDNINSIAPTNSEAIAADLLDSIVELPPADPSASPIQMSVRDVLASGIV